MTDWDPGRCPGYLALSEPNAVNRRVLWPEPGPLLARWALGTGFVVRGVLCTGLRAVKRIHIRTDSVSMAGANVTLVSAKEPLGPQ